MNRLTLKHTVLEYLKGNCFLDKSHFSKVDQILRNKIFCYYKKKKKLEIKTLKVLQRK